jgi:hypothetical protein
MTSKVETRLAGLAGCPVWFTGLRWSGRKLECGIHTGAHEEG